MNALEKKIAMEQKLDLIIEKLEKVEEQTTLTNGRVTKLEKWQALLKGVWLAVGVIALVGSFICGVVFSILTYLK